MRVGIDLRHLSSGPITGVGAITEPLLREFIVRAPEDTFRLFYNGRASPPKILSVLPQQYKNVSVVTRRIPNRIFDFRLKIFRRPFLDDLLGGVDVFLSFNALVTPLQRAPRVLILHDLSFVIRPEWFSPASRRWHRLMNIRRQAVVARALVVPSQATAFDLQRLWKIPASKTSVVPWGTSEEIRTPKFEIRNSTPKSRYILFVGTIERRKNVLGLVEAFELLKKDSSFNDVKLVLAGAEGWGSQGVIFNVQRSKFKRDIVLRGYVDEEEKRTLLRQAAVFVYPSFYEGFGLPVLEAMAAGVPIVAGNKTSLPEVAGNAALLVDPVSSDEIACAIAEILCDETLAQELSRRARQRAQQFSWSKAAESILATLRDISYSS